MNVPYRELLEKIHEHKRSYEGFISPPATPDQVNDLRSRIRAELGCDLPEEYATFLQLSDGLNWNGLTIFGCKRRRIGQGRRSGVLDGCVEANLDCRDVEGYKHLLVFGEADMDYYVRDNKTGLYLMNDRVSHDTYETFESFDALATEALRRRLLEL